MVRERLEVDVVDLVEGVRREVYTLLAPCLPAFLPVHNRAMDLGSY